VFDLCEHANEHLGCIKCNKFLYNLTSYQLIKEHSSLWSNYVTFLIVCIKIIDNLGLKVRPICTI
jgi:hypothetical protein